MTNNSKSIKEQVDAITRKLKESLGSRLKNKSFYTDIGKDLSKQIKTRTQLGYGVNDSDKQQRLKALKPSTKETRKRYSENLHSNTAPSKSNLTATGQMLDAIDYSATNSKVTIDVKGNRQGELSGSRSRITNKEVAGHVTDNGRPFFRLATHEIAELKRKIEKIIQDLIKKEL